MDAGMYLMEKGMGEEEAKHDAEIGKEASLYTFSLGFETEARLSWGRNHFRSL